MRPFEVCTLLSFFNMFRLMTCVLFCPQWASLLWILLSAAACQVYSDEWHSADRKHHRKCHFPSPGRNHTSVKHFDELHVSLADVLPSRLPDLRRLEHTWSVLCSVFECTLTWTSAWWPDLSLRCQKMAERIKLEPSSIICHIVNICYGNLEAPCWWWHDYHVCCLWLCLFI